MSSAVFLAKIASFGIFTVIIHYLYRHATSPLRHIPGPFWAKFSDIWRLVVHYRAAQADIELRLHQKLGPAVRLGPQFVSLSDPSLLPVVYSARGTFVKSDFYSVNDAVQDGHTIQNVFGARDNAFHARYMRPLRKLYSLQNILRMESRIDKTLISLCTELNNRFVDGDSAAKICDISDWVTYFAWDVVGETSFTQEMGFLKTGSDVDDIIRTGETIMHYFGIVGQIPILDKLLGKNPYCPISFPTFARPAGYCVQRFMERVSGQVPGENRGDFLDSFLEAKDLYPGVVTDNEVVGYLLLNILGGADTTALVQKAIIYHVLKNPAVLEKLQQELDEANVALPPRYESVRKLPYLDAVIKESLRIHPVVSQILPRIVPPAGLELPDGRFIAPGTTVGMNAWVISRDKSVYGEDAVDFRPERWLQGSHESEDAFNERLKRMKDADFTFGAGRRVCAGKAQATVELFKLTTTLFSKYDMELQGEWKVRKWWFTYVDNVRVKISRRSPKGIRNKVITDDVRLY